MFKDILQSKWFTVAILAMAGFFSLSIVKLSLPLITVSRELKNINQKIDEAKKSNLELEELGSYLQSDAYVERQARIRLNYKKPDEKVVYVYRNPSAKIPNDDTVAGKTNNKFFANITEWFKHLLR